MFDFLRRFVDDIATFVFGGTASNAPQRPDLQKLAAEIDAAPVREGAPSNVPQVVEQSEVTAPRIATTADLATVQAFKRATSRLYIDGPMLPMLVRKAENDALNSAALIQPLPKV